MLFLLRKLRKQMIQKNKVTTYILYAIGEIVLVVVGILIAVNIDDWNEQKKKDAKIESLFREVQDNLALDIQKANDALRYYKERDSLIRQALANKFTAEDYKGDQSRTLRRIITSAHHIKIHDNGYIKLMNHSDNIPLNYKSLLELLNEMYVFQKYEIDMFDERMNLLTDQNNDYLSQNKPWFYKMKKGDSDDEIIDYYINDPFYKNKLETYQTYAIGNYATWIFQFAKNAQKAYKMISEQLGDTAKLPEFIGQNIIEPSPDEIRLFSGTYEVIESGIYDNFIGIKFTMNPYDNHLTFHFGNDEKGSEIFFRSDKQLYNGYGVTISIDPASSPSALILNFSGATRDAKLKKID